MKTSYDSGTDSLYLELRPLPSKRTVEVEPVGYDIQHASTKAELIGRLILVSAAAE